MARLARRGRRHEPFLQRGDLAARPQCRRRPRRQARLHRHGFRADLWRAAEAELPRRQHAAPARRPPRRARRHDHARHGRFSGRVPRRDPRRRRAGAAQHAFDVGSICLCAGGLPRAGAVRFRGALSGRQGHRRPHAGSRPRRRLRQECLWAQATVRGDSRARATSSRPWRPMPTSRRSGCIPRARPACPRACGICMPIWRRPPTRMPNRCSAFARTMFASRRPNCSSPTASAMR